MTHLQAIQTTNHVSPNTLNNPMFQKKINTKSRSSLRYATSTENLGLPHPRLIDLKYPTSNIIDYDFVELCKIESSTINGPSLPI